MDEMVIVVSPAAVRLAKEVNYREVGLKDDERMDLKKDVDDRTVVETVAIEVMAVRSKPMMVERVVDDQE
jgi:hypothetical protein